MYISHYLDSDVARIQHSVLFKKRETKKNPTNVKMTSSDNVVSFLTVTCVNLLIPKYIPPFSIIEARFEARTCRQLCPLAGFEPRTRYQLAKLITALEKSPVQLGGKNLTACITCCTVKTRIGRGLASLKNNLTRKLKSRYGARNRFQAPSQELSSQAGGPVRQPYAYLIPSPIVGLKLPTLLKCPQS
jgi:hypothetical protein